MRLTIWRVLFLLPLCGSSIFAADAETWTVTDSDFQSQLGKLKSLSASDLQLLCTDGTTKSIPVGKVLKFSRTGISNAQPPSEVVEPRSGQSITVNGVPMTITLANSAFVTLQAPDGQQRSLITSQARKLLAANASVRRVGPLALVLSNGDQIIGDPMAMDNAQLTWKSDAFGEIKVPIDQARRIVRLPDKQPPTTAASEDVIDLINGDSLHGILASLSTDSLGIQSANSQLTTVLINTVQQVQLAKIGPATLPASSHGFSVNLVDGSRLTVSELTFADNGWALTRVDGGAITLPLAQVRQVEQRGGPVVWLSDLPPAESVSRSFLGRDWPTQFNAAVDGAPLTFGPQRFDHGMGVHAYSHLVFDLPEGFDRLHISYGIQGDAPYADVTVRILLDGKAVEEASHVRAGVLATPANFPLNGARQVTLEVGFGDNQDVQDRFEWIEPALLRAAAK